MVTDSIPTPPPNPVVVFLSRVHNESTAEGKLARMIEARTELGKQIVEMAKAAFMEGCTALFAAHPKLKSFGWDQYTPGFNDGDPCYFSAHTDSPLVNGFKPQYEDWKEWVEENFDADAGEKPEFTEEEASAMEEAVIAFLNKFPGDTLEEMYGDGVTVHVTPEKITTEYYSEY